MTTIAWTGDEVAADTLGTVSDLIQQSPTEKLIKHKGVIYCLTGDFAQCLAVVDWLKCGADLSAVPEFLDEPGFDILVIKDSATGHIFANSFHPYPVSPPVTLGTGHQIALGAIMAGATAHQAVEHACRVDVNSGPPIMKMKVRKCQPAKP